MTFYKPHWPFQMPAALERSRRPPGSLLHGALERASAPLADELNDLVDGALTLLEGRNRH